MSLYILLNIAQYNRGGKKKTSQKKGCQKGKKKEYHTTPPGGRRAKMKNVSKSVIMEISRQTKIKDADMGDYSKKREHIDYTMRKIIQKLWNFDIDSPKHCSIKQLAVILRIPYTTLRDELKRGCVGGQSCFYLANKKKYQYFPYNAKRAQEDAREKASHKGPRFKITTTFLAHFEPYLEKWRSIPAAYQMLKNENPEYIPPSLRSIYYHATDSMSLSKAFEKSYRYYRKRKQYKKPEIAKNHKPDQTIEKLKEEIGDSKPKGYFQMDLVVSSVRGTGGLLTFVSPGYPKEAFIRKLPNLRRKTVHKALRSIMKEATEKGITITRILTDNGTEFTDTTKIQKITGAMLFYTHAYAAWEKGSVENFNRIIRRFYPKGTDFSKVSTKEILELQEILVNYPRPSQYNKELVA